MLLDGQRMMITSKQIPYIISRQMLSNFYKLLTDSRILTEAEAEQTYAAQLAKLEKNEPHFQVVK